MGISKSLKSLHTSLQGFVILNNYWIKKVWEFKNLKNQFY